jgi:hypothetical protein
VQNLRSGKRLRFWASDISVSSSWEEYDVAEMGISLKHLPDGSSVHIDFLAFCLVILCPCICIHIFLFKFLFSSRSLTRHQLRVFTPTL